MSALGTLDSNVLRTFAEAVECQRAKSPPYARSENWCSLVVELSADVPTFRIIKGSDCALGGRADSKNEISSRALSRLQKEPKPVGGSQ